MSETEQSLQPVITASKHFLQALPLLFWHLSITHHNHTATRRDRRLLMWIQITVNFCSLKYGHSYRYYHSSVIYLVRILLYFLVTSRIQLDSEKTDYTSKWVKVVFHVDIDFIPEPNYGDLCMHVPLIFTLHKRPEMYIIHSPATLLGTPVQLLGNTNC